MSQFDVAAVCCVLSRTSYSRCRIPVSACSSAPHVLKAYVPVLGGCIFLNFSALFVLLFEHALEEKKQGGSVLNVITSFHEKHRLKQMEFERHVLQDLSFSDIEQVVRHHFASFLKSFSSGRTPIEEVCIDYAVESYLLGASYGRFGYYGETRDQVHVRCQHDIKTLSDHLFDYWSFWGDSDESFLEAVYGASMDYITDWWERGFINGEKRHRLRMH